jgi:riboflavin synthase
MFTGIVEELGKVKNLVKGVRSTGITIECSKILKDVNIGDSIAVNGICLTVTEAGGSWFTADVMPETLRKTGLGSLRLSDKVNLERALQLSDRLGGHIVSGHIDGTGIISEVKREDNAIWLTVSASDSILKYIVMKGSVAIDGTSLTVAYVDENCFKVSLIPLTANETTHGLKKTGDIVNVECDIIGKYVEKLLGINPEAKTGKKDLSVDFLRENGFA